MVDEGQHAHFGALFDIAKRLLPDQRGSLSHVGFGRVSGMSSRRGTAVLLSGVLEEATAAMAESMAASANTKTTEDLAAEALAVSVVAVNFMSRKKG